MEHKNRYLFQLKILNFPKTEDFFEIIGIAFVSSSPVLSAAIRSDKQIKISSNAGTTWDFNSQKLPDPEE